MIDTAQTMHEYKDKLEKLKIKLIRKEELVFKNKSIQSKLIFLDKEILELESEINNLKNMLKI